MNVATAAPQSRAPRAGYDYIFAGAGCAGLSLLMHLVRAGLAKDKKILLIDRDAKKTNDRTWCFWEKDAGLFEPVVHKRWQRLHFYSRSFSGPLHIAPYTYKLIRGIDFYTYCFEQIRQYANIEWLQADVSEVGSADTNGFVVAGGVRYEAFFVFNSIVPPKPLLKPHQYWLLQHFKGWLIQTPEPRFDPGAATLMDFRPSQERGTAFVYVLPFAPNRALVEYTLFSKSLLPHGAYDAALKEYLKHQLQLEDYTIVENEFGVIPMTNYHFTERAGCVLNIGTAGGNTKASSGYTFRFIQKKSVQITDSLMRFGHPFALAQAPARFGFYDSVLLHILHHGQLPGDRIFAQLFQKNKAAQVLRFLDNETGPAQELGIISSLPTLAFSKAAAAYLRNRLMHDKVRF